MLPKNETPTLAQMRARIGRAVKAGDEDEARTARREYMFAKLEDQITRAVDEAPPLTEAQRDRLRVILAGSNG